MLVSLMGAFVQFGSMVALFVVLYVIGIALCIVELFMPGFGIFGIAGLVSVVASMVILVTGGGTLGALLIMIAVTFAVLGTLFFVLSRSATKGRLGKSALFDVGTAVPEDVTEGTGNYTYLVGCEGVTITSLHPVGKAKFDNSVLDVVCSNGFVEQNEEIIVVGVEGQRIIVDKK